MNDMAIRVDLIPALTDNYIFALSNDQGVIIVDPGDATPVGDFLASINRHLSAIIITHAHHDHVDGASLLRLHYHCPVYAPQAEQALIEAVTHVDHWVQPGDQFELLGHHMNVIGTEGHSFGHVSYYLPGTPGHLFAGDALFVLGAGRVADGLEAEWSRSMDRLRQLPDDTIIYSSHEYAMSNLRFAEIIDPDNPDLQARALELRHLRQQHAPTVPSTMAIEKKTNPFLRAEQILTDLPWPQAALMLRRQKDVFR